VPWLPQPASWAGLSVEAETADPGSTLSLYRAALRIRRGHPGLAGDAFSWVDGAPAGTLWFARGDLRCCVNLSPDPVRLPAGRRTLLSSVAVGGDLLPRDAAAWYEDAAG
jgi:alpha-glucosidase